MMGNLDESRKIKWYGAAAMAMTILFAPARGAAQSSPTPVQIVAVDECDPQSFNDPAVAGADFCKNVALGASTPFDVFQLAAKNGTPDPKWDFEPDEVRVKKGTPLVVVNQGGEPHTFTEVKKFGGGFLDFLNAKNEQTVPECNDGFKNLAVARTRFLQGSQLQVSGLSKGEHHFQCCIHPWMRLTVDVKENHDDDHDPDHNDR
jgi:plastocyanin